MNILRLKYNISNSGAPITSELLHDRYDNRDENQ
jgi:hypothetical protein